MKFLTSRKFKVWNNSACATLMIICAVFKFFLHYNVEMVLYAILAWFFFSNAFEKVESKKQHKKPKFFKQNNFE